MARHWRHRRYNRSSHRRYVPFFKRRNVQRTIISFIAAIFVTFLALEVRSSIFQWINAGAWLLFSYYLYRGLYRKINRVGLHNDLNYIAMRVIAFVILLIGFIFGGGFYMAMMLGGYDPVSTGILIVILGFAGMGVFMLFRTDRRYWHLYVNRGH